MVTVLGLHLDRAAQGFCPSAPPFPSTAADGTGVKGLLLRLRRRRTPGDLSPRPSLRAGDPPHAPRIRDHRRRCTGTPGVGARVRARAPSGHRGARLTGAAKEWSSPLLRPGVDTESRTTPGPPMGSAPVFLAVPTRSGRRPRRGRSREGGAPSRGGERGVTASAVQRYPWRRPRRAGPRRGEDRVKGYCLWPSLCPTPCLVANPGDRGRRSSGAARVLPGGPLDVAVAGITRPVTLTGRERSAPS